MHVGWSNAAASALLVLRALRRLSGSAARIRVTRTPLHASNTPKTTHTAMPLAGRLCRHTVAPWCVWPRVYRVASPEPEPG